MARSRVTGAQEAKANMRRAATLLAAPLNAATKRSLEPTMQMAHSLLPFPRLRRTMRLQRLRSSAKTSPVYRIGFIGLGLKVAHLIEFGSAPHSLAKGASRRKGLFQDQPPFHPGTSKQPFMTPAFEATRGNIPKIFGQEFWPAWQRHLDRLAVRAAKRAASTRTR